MGRSRVDWNLFFHIGGWWSRCFWSPWCGRSPIACHPLKVKLTQIGDPCILNPGSTFAFAGLGIIASSTPLQRRSPDPQPHLLLQSLLMAQSVHWERWQTNNQYHSWWKVSLWAMAVVLFSSQIFLFIWITKNILSFFYNPLIQVGGGSFHPSTLISATQLAVAVGEEVPGLTWPFFLHKTCINSTFSQVDRKLMAKLKDEEALGDTRERIGFL